LKIDYLGPRPMRLAEKLHCRLVLGILLALCPGRILYPRAWTKLSTLTLHTFAWLGWDAGIVRLHALGVPVDSREEIANSTPLMCAAHRGRVDTVRLLLAAGADPCARDEYDGTALDRAAENGHEAVVAQLIAAGADVNAQDRVGFTPLMRASGEGHVAVMEALVAAGASIHAEGHRGLNAWRWADAQGRPESLEWLIGATRARGDDAGAPGGEM
jgi:hypothetical protein